MKWRCMYAVLNLDRLGNWGNGGIALSSHRLSSYSTWIRALETPKIYGVWTHFPVCFCYSSQYQRS